MMERTLTVIEVSRMYGVTARMLRHYEKLGLMESARKEDYAYRVYREQDIRRLRQILALRKMRVSLKDIGAILADPGTGTAIAVLEKTLARMNAESEALGAVRDVVAEFLDALKRRPMLPAGTVLLEDGRLLDSADDLSPSSTLIREERKSAMERMEQAAGAMTDVRIIHLPASDVAAAHVVGDEPEDRAGTMIAGFVRAARLWERHPGLRLYGFNHPNPVDDSGWHGYEFWVTVPEDVEVPPPLERKRFEGGTYAAHMIRMGDFQEWAWLDEWVKSSDEYEYAGNGDPETMFGALEEHLNYHDDIRDAPEGEEPRTRQLDLLIPVRRKGNGK